MVVADRWWLLAGASLAACGAGPPLPPAPPSNACLLRLEFAPPLAEPGELRVEHECGERWVLRTGRLSVEVRLPPGPVALTLTAGGVVRQRVMRVELPAATFVWSWRE